MLPFILRVFPQEIMAIWNIFSTIIALSSLFDFGFNSSFTRNVSYVVSGANKLKKTGYYIVENTDKGIDYSLLKGIINVMQYFYFFVGLIFFMLLMTAGSYYIYRVIRNYSGNHAEVYISWTILCFINTYSLYTSYYDSLMQGQGLIKRAKQINAAGQIVYLMVAIILILLHFNLIAIVSAQALSVIIRRVLSYQTIYTKDFKYCLKNTNALPKSGILKSIYPNAIKLGLNNIATFLILRSSVIIGSLYLSLDLIASYGITIQIIGIISSIGGIYFSTYIPKIAEQRIHDDNISVKHLFLKGWMIQFITFIVFGLALLFLGNWIFNFINSKTPLLSKFLITIALIVAFNEANISLISNIPLSKNEIPFFKAGMVVGITTVILLFIFFRYTNLGVLGMIIAPGIAEFIHLKWVSNVIKELRIENNDIYYGFSSIIGALKK
ncbi:hypothetical protein AGMMS49546_34530 [Spirochaetia bacterium]|nr:hypothetical protein AGMMS49546_34530 [Spirochaetia bacterium]